MTSAPQTPINYDSDECSFMEDFFSQKTLGHEKAETEKPVVIAIKKTPEHDASNSSNSMSFAGPLINTSFAGSLSSTPFAGPSSSTPFAGPSSNMSFDDFLSQMTDRPLSQMADGPLSQMADGPLRKKPRNGSLSKKSRKHSLKKTFSSSYLSDDTDWPTILREFDTLMMNRTKINGTRFNQLTLMLLRKCVATARSKNNPQTNEFNHQDEAQEAFGAFRNLLLNAKEMQSEDLVEKVVAFVDKGLSPLLTAEERKEELQKKSISLVSGLSPQLSIKTTPIIKSYITRLFGSDLDDILAEVRLPGMSLKEKSLMYTRMFENFFDRSNCLSFAASNKQLLGDLDPADIWFLTFFAFVTVKRSRGDNLLMLGLVGKYFIL